MPITIKPAKLKYKNPTTSEYVPVAAVADYSAIIDDTAGNGDTNKVWSADKSFDTISTKLDAPASAGASGQVLTSDGQGGQTWQTPSADVVEDVQINGTSIVSSGIANIPEADRDTYGVLKTGYTTTGLQKDASGYLKTYCATADNVKEGTEAYRPIVPYRQHESVFYGLAKASGDSTQSASNNPVGTYTEDAKSSIRNMLGITAEIDAVDNQVIISSSQPQSTSNKLWINNSGGSEVSIPTYAEFEALSDSAVTDVQVNGTTVVSSGVANIPVASTSAFGVLKVGEAASGLQPDSSGYLKTAPSNSSRVKAGTEYYRPLVPSIQHESTFFGLAKAAGADMASISSTTVGQYPDAQKVAIQKMLGIYEAPWELIREDTVTNSTSQELIISVDGDGNSFQLTDAVVIAIVPTQNTDFTISDYCRVYFRKDGTNIRNGFLANNQSKTFGANSSINVGFATFMQEHGLLTSTYTEFAVKSTHAYPRITTTDLEDDVNTPYGIKNTYIDSIRISEFVGTLQYRILGRRKWT